LSTRSPTVALVTDAIAPYHWGGKEQRYRALAPRLANYAEVHIYTMRWWEAPRTVVQDGVTYHAICPKLALYKGGRRSILQAVLFALGCLRLVTARFDVLEADHMPYLQLIPLKLVASIRRRRFVVTWHEVWDAAQWSSYLGRAGRLAWSIERLAMRLPDCIVAASPETAERLRSHLGDTAEIVTAVNGVDLNRIAGIAPADDEIDIVSVGRLLSHKRFDLLIDCVARLAAGGILLRCCIIGSGSELEALQSQARRLGVDHLLDFRTDVESEDSLIALMKAARVCVLPSEREGFGIAALEAIACQIPVITTSAPDNLARDLVGRARRGHICPPTAEALADAVMTTLRAEDTESSGGLDEWVTTYDWDRVAEVVAGVLLEPRKVSGSSSAAYPPAGDRASVPSPGVGSHRRELLDSVALVGVMTLACAVRGVWAIELVALVLLITVPGLLVLRAAHIPADAVRAFPLYLLVGSLAAIMGSGLAVDLVGPLLGVARPLATAPLLVGLVLSCAAMVAVATRRGAPSLRDYMNFQPRLRESWALILPLLAWVGAMRLTNHHGNTVAVLAVTLTGVALLAGSIRARRATASGSVILIYCVALSLMWGFSLRSHFVFGFDIAGEYHNFVSVARAGVWHASNRDNAYGATLSLTVLPSSLAALTGASPLLVLKVIYPAMFASFAVAVFLLARGVLRDGFAYFAALFLLVQSYLFEELPAIARQEIGLLFFVCLIAAVVDRHLSVRQRAALITGLGMGLAVSHYSTAYLAIVVLAVAVVLEVARSVLTKSHTRGLAPVAVALASTLLASAVWYGPVTHSSQNVSRFTEELNNKGLSLLPNAGGQGIINAYLTGNTQKRVSATEYEALAVADYAKDRHYVHPLPGSSSQRLRNANLTNPPIVSHVLSSLLHIEQILAGQLANVLAALGAVVLWLRRRTGHRLHTVALLGVSTLVALAVIRLSGTAAEAYNQERAFVQSMVPLSITLAAAIQWIGTRRGGRVSAFAAALALIGFFVTTSGLRGALLGGGTSANLANSGEGYDRFYLSSAELAAATWVTGAAPRGDLVYADRYGAVRIIGATGRSNGILTQLTPPTLDSHAWVYADRANFVDHLTRGLEGNRYALYEWPRFIEQHWNLVYSSGSAAVYGRPR